MKATPNYKRFLWYFVFAITITAGIFNKVILNSGDYYDLYSADRPTNQSFDFKFIRESFLISTSEYHNHYYRSYSPAQVAVGDLNNDGLDDFIFITKNDKKNLIGVQMNQQGKRFKNNHDLEMQIWALTDFKKSFNAVAIVDIDNDGWNDLVFVAKGCVYFMKNNQGHFENNFIQPICTEGDKRNVNLVDVNNDGYIDLYFSSYQETERGWLPPAVSNGHDGGKNILLLNQAGKGFIDATKKFGITGKSLSWTAAIADFNNDGYPDILDINDFGYDQYFENSRGQKFIDQTSKSLNIKHVSYSMSGEVADFNNDGQFDVYISNVNRPTFFAGYNMMLMNDNGKFTDVAKQKSVSACGWSWGARAFEPNHDLESAIFVVNSPSQPINQGERSSLYSSPIFARKIMEENFSESIPKANFANVARFQEKNCLFYKNGNQYIDIAEATGIDDVEGGKAIAEIDFNNDGVSDFIIANINSSPIFYRGIYTGKNKWIGFKLKGTKSNQNAIGAIVEIEYDKGYKKKQIYPTNGYQSQSTTHLIFGIPENMKIKNITIKWPSGIKQKVEEYNVEQYNEISER